MNLIPGGLIIVFAIIVALIGFTIYNLLPLGDERRRMIQLEAGAYSFGVVVFYLLIEIVAMAYTNLATPETFDNLNPFITLIVFSLIYLFTLVRTKRKYS